MAKGITVEPSWSPITPVNQIKWPRLVNSELAIKPRLRLGFVSKHVGDLMMQDTTPHPLVTSWPQLCTQLVKSESIKVRSMPRYIKRVTLLVQIL